MDSDQATWVSVDAYFTDRLVDRDEAFRAALERSVAAGLPPHHVAPNQGKWLMMMATLVRAKRILEIGTLGGYSPLWLARALASTAGIVVTLEANPLHAEVAQANFVDANVTHLVDLRLGPAEESLAALVAGGAAPFDLIFIDADKPRNPLYLARALDLSRPGTLIIVDNVVRDGRVIDPLGDASVQGVRNMVDLIASESRLEATALQTVGGKGYDGFLMAIVSA